MNQVEFNFEREPRDENFVEWFNDHKDYLSSTFFSTHQNLERTYDADLESYHRQTFEEWTTIMYQIDIDPVRSYSTTNGYIANSHVLVAQ